MKKLLFFIFIVISISLLQGIDFKVMSYNSLRFPDNSGAERVPYFRTIFTDIVPDILIMQEIGTEAGADTLLSILNSIENKYSRAEFTDYGALNSILFYNNQYISLVSQSEVSATPRVIPEYVLNVAGSELRCYSCHLRASTGEENEAERLEAVTSLRNHIDTLPEGTEFLIAGDMNFYTSDEPAYQKFIADEENNIGRAKDLCNFVGNWHDNESFSNVHTQSPRANAFGGGIGGGLDDKFDFIFSSYNLNNNQGVEFVENSFVPYGNDGHHFNQSINNGENTAVSPQIADALYYASDHLPVYANFYVDAEFLSVLSPNGGEYWYSGETHDILWQSSIPDSNITIKLLKDNPPTEIILAQNLPNTETWSWTIPADMAAASDYKIEVSSNNLSDSSNDYFAINTAVPQNILMLSEYVEGSSYNKALEIFNPEDHTVDLSGFSLKKQTNGAGDFGNEFDLSGELASHEVLVFVHPSACPELLALADFMVSGICNFNGNDAIGLFKNDELKDLVGNIDSSENWGKDITLVRNSNVAGPSPEYIPDQWIEYPEDTFSYLGYHDYDPASTDSYVIEAPDYKILAYPNPFFIDSYGKNTALKFDMPSSQNVIIEFYNLKGEKITQSTLNNQNSIEIDSRKFQSSGVYLYRIKTDSNSHFGKITIIK